MLKVASFVQYLCDVLRASEIRLTVHTTNCLPCSATLYSIAVQKMANQGSYRFCVFMQSRELHRLPRGKHMAPRLIVLPATSTSHGFVTRRGKTNMKCQVRLSARSFSKSSLQCSFHVFDLLLSAPASGECLFGARVADLTDKVPHMMTIGPIAPLSNKEAMMSSSKTIPTLHPYHHVFGKRQVADETGGRYCQDFLRAPCKNSLASSEHLRRSVPSGRSLSRQLL